MIEHDICTIGSAAAFCPQEIIVFPYRFLHIFHSDPIGAAVSFGRRRWRYPEDF